MLQLESSALKYKLKRSDGNKQELFLRSVHQVLKCCNSLISSYTHQLPFFYNSTLFPPSLTSAVKLISSAGSHMCDNFLDGQQLIADSNRLLETINKFSIAKSKTATFQNGTLVLIKNLAEQKFGGKNVETKQKLGKVRQKVILPKPNKMFEMRAKLAREKRSEESSCQISTPTNHQDGDELSEKLKQMAFETFSSSPLMFQPTDDQLFEKLIKPTKPNTLELDDSELNNLIRYKESKTIDAMSIPDGSALYNRILIEQGQNPMQFVAQISEGIVQQVVQQICEEFISVDVISKLIDVEFK